MLKCNNLTAEKGHPDVFNSIRRTHQKIAGLLVLFNCTNLPLETIQPGLVNCIKRNTKKNDRFMRKCLNIQICNCGP